MALPVACNRVGDIPSDGPVAITVEASIGEMAKVTTTGDYAVFDSGDKISVYAWTGAKTAVPAGQVVSGVENSYDGAQWTAATPMLWADMVTEHYFVGIYPARAVSDFKADPFTLDPADYQASDLLIAVNTTGLKATARPVKLTFAHAMARLFVSLSFRNQWETAPTVASVTATACTSARIDYLSETPATATGTASPVALKAIDNASWSGLQVPQTGVRTITVTIDGKNYVYTHNEDIPLAGGRNTTLNLIVGRDRIDLGFVSITNWIPGTTINNGEAQTEDD